MGVGDIVFNGVGAAGATSSASGFDLRISGNTTGTTALVSSGTLTLAGGTNVTLSQSGNAITIVGANTGTFQQWWPWQGMNVALSFGNGVPYFFPIDCPNYVTATKAFLALSMTLSTSSNSSHAGSLSFQMGIFTNNAGTLSSASSGSASYAWTDTAGGSTASLTGQRLISIPINVNMTPGQYVIGLWSSTQSANANWITLRNVGMGVSTLAGSFAGASSGTTNMALGYGHWSGQASLPGTVSFQNLSNNGAQDACGWNFTLINSTHP